MAETKTDLSNRAIKNRIIKVIEYRLFSIKHNMHDISKGKTTTVYKKMLQKLETEKKLLENCLIWMSEQ